jgi:hypothetical protein
MLIVDRNEKSRLEALLTPGHTCAAITRSTEYMVLAAADFFLLGQQPGGVDQQPPELVLGPGPRAPDGLRTRSRVWRLRPAIARDRNIVAIR